MNYKERLQEAYEEYIESPAYPEQVTTKLDWVSENIFEFTTYDDEISIEFGQQMVDVIKALLNVKTYDYIKDNYKTYLYMVNMPFLRDKIEWGTSIRGSWIDEYAREDFKILYDWVIPKGEIKQFLTALIEWVES